LTYHIACFVVE